MKKLLDCAMDIGEAMLLSGAEVHRVESFIATKATAAIITSSMIVTVHTKDGGIFTETRRITASGTDYEKLDKLNSLSRKICYQGMTPEEIDAELNEINKIKAYPFWLEVVAYAIIAGAFTLFFGGGWLESLVSLVIGGAVRGLIFVSDIFVKNKIFTKFIASFVSAGAAYIAHNLGIVPDVDEIIIGNIMTLIPGIGLTNALRDLFTGDSIAGLLRTIEAALTALAIAAGYFVLVITMGGAGIVGTPPEIIEWLQIVMGTVGTVGFAILFNIRGKKLIMVALGGLLAWSFYLAIYHLSGSEMLGYFISAALISVFSELMARLLKTPTTAFIITSLVPLIPGGSLYKTMRFAFSGNLSSFSQTGLQTVELAAALALGIIVSSAICKPILRFVSLRAHRRGMLNRYLK